KVQRCFESGDYVEQHAIECPDAIAQRALQLIECRLRLKRRGSVDQIGHVLRVGEVDSRIQERPERELTWSRETSTSRHEAVEYSPEHDRASVCADLDDLLSRVRMWCGKPRHDHRVRGTGESPVLEPHLRQRRLTREERFASGEDVRRHLTRSRSAQSYDTNATSPWRSCDGHNRVVGREHAVTRKAVGDAAAPAALLSR